MTKGRTTSRRPAWRRFGDERLLRVRVCDLGVRIPGSRLERRVHAVEHELDAAGVDYHPPCYLADEWECPDGIPAVGIPFYLAHPRLVRLERAMMVEAEGDGAPQFARLLRHELGHAINYAFRLFRRKRWRELFGPFNAVYRDTYRVAPHSRKFVRHLSRYYAQKHPDEDFAETFAVWLDPASDWRKKYAGWDAAVKLEYVDGLMRDAVAGREPKVVARKSQYYWRADRMRCSLATYYKRRKAAYAWARSHFFDEDLKKLFPVTPQTNGATAAAFLRRKRAELASGVRAWSGEPPAHVRTILNELVERCEQLDLRMGIPEEEAAVNVTAYVTALAVNYRRGGRPEGGR